jgi:hypothetical protein
MIDPSALEMLRGLPELMKRQVDRIAELEEENEIQGMRVKVKSDRIALLEETLRGILQEKLVAEERTDQQIAEIDRVLGGKP